MRKVIVLLVVIVSLFSFVSAGESVPVVDCQIVSGSAEGETISFLEKGSSVELEVEDREVKIKIVDGGIEFNGEIVTWNENEEIVSTEKVFLKPKEGSVFQILVRNDKGEMVVVNEFDTMVYGTRLLNIAEGEGIFTYDQWDNALGLIIGHDFYFGYSFEDGAVKKFGGACMFLELRNECSDGQDNDGDGYVDTNGICSDGRVCFCDYDGDKEMDEVEKKGPYYCSEEYTGLSNLNYYCVGEGGISSKGCENYLYEDDTCLYGEGVSESSKYSKLYPCIDLNFALVLADCQAEGSCVEGNLEGDLLKREKVCQENYEGGVISCVRSDDCLDEQVCDEDNVCVALEALVANRDLGSCDRDNDCSFGSECVKGYCVERKVVGVTPDIPVLWWMEVKLDNIRGALAGEKMRLAIIEERLVEGRIVEDRNKKGLISNERNFKLQAKVLEEAAKGSDKAAVNIERKLGEDPNDLDSQELFKKLNYLVSQESQKISDYSAFDVDKKRFGDAEKSVERVLSRVESSKKISESFKENFGESNADRKFMDGYVTSEGVYASSNMPRVVKKLEEQGIIVESSLTECLQRSNEVENLLSKQAVISLREDALQDKQVTLDAKAEALLIKERELLLKEKELSDREIELERKERLAGFESSTESSTEESTVEESTEEETDTRTGRPRCNTNRGCGVAGYICHNNVCMRAPAETEDDPLTGEVVKDVEKYSIWESLLFFFD